jgi:hypothetical protein
MAPNMIQGQLWMNPKILADCLDNVPTRPKGVAWEFWRDLERNLWIIVTTARISHQISMGGSWWLKKLLRRWRSVMTDNKPYDVSTIWVHKGTIRNATATTKSSGRPDSGENPPECTLGRLDRAIADSDELTVGIVEELKNVTKRKFWL